MNIWKGIGAIVAGMVFIVISHSGTDFVLEKLGIFTQPNEGFHTPWMVVTATIYRCVFTIVGGYITAAPGPKSANAIRDDTRINRAPAQHPGRNRDHPDGNSASLVSHRARGHRIPVHLARRNLTSQVAG